MQIRVTCPECGKSFQIPERFAGREGECSKCQAIFHIPERAARVPEAKRKARPASPVTDSGTATGRASRPVQDAGVTEEIAVYSIEPSDEFEPVAPAPVAPPKPPVFDITDADLLPDDDDLSDDASSPAPLDVVFVDEEEDDSEDLPAIHAQHAAPRTKPRKRRSREAYDAQKKTRRRPQEENASDEASDDEPADLSAFVNADSGDENAASDATVPLIRRRRSGEEHSDSELPSRRSKPSNAKPQADDDDLSSEHSGRKSNPRQLAIVGGIGVALLLGAFLYSHFSAPPSVTIPVVVHGPTDAPGDSAAVETNGSAASGEVSAPALLASTAPLPLFPPLPESQASAVAGISYYEIDLSGGKGSSESDGDTSERPAPGTQMQMILYLPPGEHPDGSLSCVLITPAGTSLLEGTTGFDESYRDETLPYVEAGFAVVGYSLDGALESEQPTEAELNAAYLHFRAAQAGLVNARNALEFVLARVPQVAPDRIYSVGHSSAGTLSLLFAAHEPRLAGSIAYAPCTDPEKRLADFLSNPVTNRIMPGVTEFARFESPLQKASRIKCPVFLFHSEDDSNVPVAESQTFADRLVELGNQPTLKLIATGGHYDAMVNEGIPAAIEWLKQQTSGK